MSAWIVSKAHIDTLVQALIAEGIIAMGEATETGRMLWHENHLSIQARYGDEPNTPEYVFEGIEAPLEEFVVLNAIGCYDYQTCEHGGWPDSRAYELASDNGLLAAVLLDRLGMNWAAVSEASRAWEKATGREIPWGIDDIHQAVK